MSRIAYVNGQYVPHAHAFVHVEDRGYQFADGVYEVCGVADGLLLDEAAHMIRLERSLRELQITSPVPISALKVILREVVRRNLVRNGIVYWQITRGVAPRDHAFPGDDVPASLVVTAKPVDFAKADAKAAQGISVISQKDIRWARPDIKSVSLLPNILAKQAAREVGAYEAWLIDDHGFVTEGSSTNVWIIDGENNLITRQLDRILAGVTRDSSIVILREMGLEIEERKISIDELLEAHANGELKEVFGTGTAATISMIKELKYKSFEMHFDTDTWQVATELKKRLNAIRDGIAADTHGWLFPVDTK
jgi:D-alanine transaminase